jgi:hypothetical protein
MLKIEGAKITESSGKRDIHSPSAKADGKE